MLCRSKNSVVTKSGICDTNTFATLQSDLPIIGLGLFCEKIELFQRVYVYTYCIQYLPVFIDEIRENEAVATQEALLNSEVLWTERLIISCHIYYENK